MVFDKPSSDPIHAAILKTLIYSDIFEFPLTKDEIWKFLIIEKKITTTEFEKALFKLKKNLISELSGYYFLKGREKIVKNRIHNAHQIKRKMRIARKAAHVLSFIPTILFIGISGGLAIGDVKKADDIDFFIITKKNTIYKTRFIILLLLEIMGLRRKRTDKKAADKICINYIVDETKLSLPAERHDLYTVHEIVQLKPLYEKANMYELFIKANNWIQTLMPNLNVKQEKLNMITKSRLSVISNINLIHLLPERVLEKIQNEFMKKHKTSETVGRHVLIFNPKDYRVQTLSKLRLKLLNLGLLTKD